MAQQSRFACIYTPTICSIYFENIYLFLLAFHHSPLIYTCFIPSTPFCLQYRHVVYQVPRTLNKHKEVTLSKNVIKPRGSYRFNYINIKNEINLFAATNKHCLTNLFQGFFFSLHGHGSR